MTICDTPLSTTFQIHHIDLRIIPLCGDSPIFHTLQSLFARRYGGVFSPCRNHRFPGYGCTTYHHRGVLVACSPKYHLSQRDDHVGLRLEGQFLETIPPEEFQGLMLEITALGQMRPSRVDLAFDGIPLTPHTLFCHAQAGNIKTALRRNHQCGSPKACEKWRSDGTTVYLGSETSDRRLAIYDRRGPTRVELRLRRDYAERACMAFAKVDWDSTEITGLAKAYVLDFTDFRFRDDLSPNGWGDRIPGWDDFADGAIAAKPPSLPPRRNIDGTRTVVWNWARVVALVAAVDAARYGGRDGWLRAYHDEGVRQLTDADRDLIREMISTPALAIAS